MALGTAATTPRRSASDLTSPSFSTAAPGAGAPDTGHHFTACGLAPAVIAVAASAAWMACSSGLILLNKDLLSHGFGYPMALSALGMGFSAVASYVTCRVLRLVDAKRTVTPRFYATRIMPVGLFMALTLLFGNLVYLYLTVAFIQMLKAFTVRRAPEKHGGGGAAARRSPASPLPAGSCGRPERHRPGAATRSGNSDTLPPPPHHPTTPPPPPPPHATQCSR
jgi:hypothetical protein